AGGGRPAGIRAAGLITERMKIMVKRHWFALPCLLMAFGLGRAEPPSPTAPEAAPDIAGDWSGTWAVYNPAQGATTPKEMCKRLDCKVVLEGGVWQATFEGDCGRP